MTKLPCYIRIQADDNMAIVVNAGGLPAGTVFPDGLTLRDHVPQGHKVSLSDLEEGAPIRRYDAVIGTASGPILRGSWVNEARIVMPQPPPLDHLPLATRVPPRAGAP